MVRTLYYPIPQFNCEETVLENDEKEDERISACPAPSLHKHVVIIYNTLNLFTLAGCSTNA